MRGQCFFAALENKHDVVALFGTSQIAANGIVQSIWSLAALVCVTMGPVFITVIGQCMGSRDTEQAEYYFRKLFKITLLISVVWNVLLFAIVMDRGVIGIAWAMCLDWCSRAVIFYIRFRKGKWKQFSLI